MAVWIAWALAIVGVTAGYASARRCADAQRLLQRVRMETEQIAAAVNGELAGQLTFTAADTNQASFQRLQTQLSEFARLAGARGIYTLGRHNGALYYGPAGVSDVVPPPAPGSPCEPRLKAIVAQVLATGKSAGVSERSGRAAPTILRGFAALRNNPESATLLCVELEVAGATGWSPAAKRNTLAAGGGLLLLALLLFLVQRRWAFSLVATQIALTGALLTAVLAIGVMDAEQARRQTIFDKLADVNATLLRDALDRVRHDIRMLQSFFAASEEVTADEFDRFVRDVIETTALESLFWAPRVSAADRADYEAAAGRGIRGRDNANGFAPAPARENYFPIRYFAPLGSDHQAAIGLDLTGMPDWADAISIAQAHQRATATSVTRPPISTHGPAVLLFAPTAGEAPGRPEGLLLGVLRTRGLLEKLYGPRRDPEATLLCCSLIVPGPPPEVISSYPEGSAECALPRPIRADANELWRREPIFIFGRAFAVDIAATASFFAAYPARWGFWALGFGLALTTTLTLLAGLLRRREFVLQRMVEERAAELTESEMRYRQLFESMTSGFALHEMIFDAQGNPRDYRFLEINPAFERLTGLRADEMIGRTVREALPATEEHWFQRYGAVVATGQPQHFEEYSAQLGRHYEVLAYRPKPGHFAVLVGDVTERRRMHDLLVRRTELQRLLVSLATRFINLPGSRCDEGIQTALEEVGRFTGTERVLLYRYDLEAGTSSCTQEWCAAEIAPTRERMQNVDLEPFADTVEQHRRGEVVLLSGDPAAPAQTPQQRLLAEQGIRTLVTLPLRVGVECLGFIALHALGAERRWTDDEVGLLKVLAELIVNVLLRRRTEQEQAEFSAKLLQTQKLESLGILAGGIAHDFNNILMTILGNADMAAGELSPLAPAHNSLREIEFAARRAADLCRQMLAYAGKGQFHVVTLDVNQLIEEMLHLLKSSLPKNALLHLHPDRQIPAVRGDATQIRQIVLNLVINAAEALEGKSGTVTLRTGAVKCNDEYLQSVMIGEDLKPGLYVTLEVADTGCGMTPETLQRIFDPFYTTKLTGRGLGLAAAQGIMRGHGGAIKVYSEKNKGSIFKLFFPALEPNHRPDGAAANGAAAPSGALGGGLVLLADDEESVRAIGARMLEKMGFSVLTARDGQEAVDMFRQRQAELRAVVLDLTMPHLSGEDAYREIVKTKPDIPVILASGYSAQELAERLAVKGLAGFIQKPYTLAELKTTLAKALRGE